MLTLIASGSPLFLGLAALRFLFGVICLSQNKSPSITAIVDPISTLSSRSSLLWAKSLSSLVKLAPWLYPSQLCYLDTHREQSLQVQQCPTPPFGHCHYWYLTLSAQHFCKYQPLLNSIGQ
ncbi:hypothetical protein Fmac_032754 [Flemingia macrophylla]|uniref:Secreted protein n=1 Tax=Flemingia macrophylla TaxID=520843 RepID=A0ABD1L688_9FABA